MSSQHLPAIPALPANASLDQLKRRAKDLRRDYQSHDVLAQRRIAQIASLHGCTELRLTQAQHVIAVELGFTSWPKLKHHLELLRLSRAERVASFITAATTGNRALARQILALEPLVASSTIHAAVTAGDLEAVRRFLNLDPAAANAEGGPQRRTPLLHLCFSTFLQGDAGRTVRMERIAALLLQHGADPNVAFTIPEDPDSQRSPLAGACYQGALGLMRILIAGGARGNDAQAGFWAMERSDRRFAELLVEHGLPVNRLSLGKKLDMEDLDGVRWLLGLGAQVNVSKGENALHWAIKRGRSLPIIDAIIRHGADLEARIALGHTQWPTIMGATALDLALHTANAQVYDLLITHGATPRDLTPLEQLLLACGHGHVGSAKQILAEHEGLLTVVSPEDRQAATIAAKRGDLTAIRSLAAVGFPLGGGEWPGGTPLHHAAMTGSRAVVEFLIQHGVALDVSENAHGSTPLQWAQHFSANGYNAAGDYAGVVEALAAAGAKLPSTAEGSDAVRAVLMRLGVPD